MGSEFPYWLAQSPTEAPAHGMSRIQCARRRDRRAPLRMTMNQKEHHSIAASVGISAICNELDVNPRLKIISIMLLGVMATRNSGHSKPILLLSQNINQHPSSLRRPWQSITFQLFARRCGVVQISLATTQWQVGAVGLHVRCMSSWTIRPEEFMSLQKSLELSTWEWETLNRSFERTAV